MERTSRRQQAGSGETQLYWPKIESGYRSQSREGGGEGEDVTEWGWSTQTGVNNRKWLLFIYLFQQSIKLWVQEEGETETPTESEVYCRPGSRSGKLNKSGLHNLALHSKYTHKPQNGNWIGHLVFPNFSEFWDCDHMFFSGLFCAH